MDAARGGKKLTLFSQLQISYKSHLSFSQMLPPPSQMEICVCGPGVILRKSEMRT